MSEKKSPTPMDAGYIEVKDRVAAFFDKYPNGTLRGDWKLVEANGDTFLAYRAEAMRDPDDRWPGVGSAWEPVPGKTNFTRDSELQNAETSAWGRAIIAIGAADSRMGIASADEVRNRQAEQPRMSPEQEAAHTKLSDMIVAEKRAGHIPDDEYAALVRNYGTNLWPLDDETMAQAIQDVAKIVADNTPEPAVVENVAAGEEPFETPEGYDTLNALTVTVLRDRCRDARIDDGGNKADLIRRLLEAGVTE